MSMNQSKDPLRVDVAPSIRKHWLLFVVEGIVLVVLGLLAVLLPPLATLGVTLFLGWLFVISGIMGLIATFWARRAPGFWWALLSAVLGIAVGLVLLINPVSGAVSLTLVWACFLRSRASPRSCTHWITASRSRAAGASCCSAGLSI